jgi:hypothetical protein
MDIMNDNSSANAASRGGGKPQYRSPAAPSSSGGGGANRLRDLRVGVPALAVHLAAPSCPVSSVDSTVILLHGAIAASNRIFLVLVTMGKAMSVKLPWRLFRGILRLILLMFLGTWILGLLTT